MTKMNKKGFTLIEMLVVIAIIAVLVAIIIPTVTSATDKAGAAANAANLRSVYAELQTDLLSTGADAEGYIIVEEDDDGKLTPRLATADDGEGSIVPPTSAKVGEDVDKGEDMELTEGELNYAGKTITDFATFAENGKWPAAADDE